MTELMDSTGVANFAALMDALDLEPVAGDVFRTRTARAEGHRLYGGEVCAQALVAAERTAPDRSEPHSLHAYFLRPGDTDLPVTFRVERLHDGRTFQRRRVTAEQRGKAILSMDASFSADHTGMPHHPPAPDAPAPDHCPVLRDTIGANWDFAPARAFDVRSAGPGLRPSGRVSDDIWFRPNSSEIGGKVSAAAVLTYFSDYTFISVLARAVRASRIRALTSLDHALWFHNDIRLDDWLLYHKDFRATGEVRGLADGQIFHRDGTLIATVAQEGLLHAARP